MVYYHLESIQLFLNLLCKHGCQTVAGSNLSSSVILSAGPGVVKLNTRTERGIALAPLWCCRDTL